MKLVRYCVRNFRRLENVQVTLEEDDTIFVGPNNSAKTSATAIFRMLVSQSSAISICDFSSWLMPQFDIHQTVDDTVPKTFPEIQLDLWFSVDPDVEYGRVAPFLTSVAASINELGVRIALSVDDADALLADYRTVYPASEINGVMRSPKSLSQFLSAGSHFRRHFGFKYFSLEQAAGAPVGTVTATPLEKESGHKALNALLRVDYVEAQRNVDDLETSRSNRLSAVFADFYKFNLEQPSVDAEAISVIDRSNEDLTTHYDKQFKPLFDLIARLGFPSINDRQLRILSSLNPEAALRGNTILQYQDGDTGHQLPEAYNGLGFKNMIFMAIQITHFQKRWICTENNRPLCHVIFIEEPEVHLHAQVQQAFIRQVVSITKAVADEHVDPALRPQLVVTTHSSHILDEVDFTKVRYFRRIVSSVGRKASPASSTIKTATEVVDLHDFDRTPSATATSQESLEQSESNTGNPTGSETLNIADNGPLSFLRKYIKLTHCDLFFSDAVIVVEGTVERLLIPSFIEKRFPKLKPAYLTILELGGAFAHLFVPLLDFIGLPTLIITDLDSVDPTHNRVTCRADTWGAVTSNKTLSTVFATSQISDLLKLTKSDRVKMVNGNPRFVASQTAVSVPEYGSDCLMIPRTFEECFIYTNMADVRKKLLQTFTPLAEIPDYGADYAKVYSTVKSDGYKKVEFALNQIATTHDWIPPAYICEGLEWLSELLTPLPRGTLQPVGSK